MALANALMKIEGGCTASSNSYDNPSYENVWISSPFGKKATRGLMNLFRTHPTTSDRIERLKALDQELNGTRY